MDKPVNLDHDELADFRAIVRNNISTYDVEKRAGTGSTDVLAQRILDDLNHLLEARTKVDSQVPRRHPEDPGDPPGFVRMTVPDVDEEAKK